jgi:RNA polymerase sigma factor (sigma-70 family)
MPRDVAERDALVLRWMPLVGRVARDFARGPAEYGDVVGAGMLALVQSCETADAADPRLKHYLANAIRWAMRRECDAACKARRVRSLDPVDSNDPLLSLLAVDPGPKPAETADRHDERLKAGRTAGRLLRLLTPRERSVVTRVFGLDGGGPMTIGDAAGELGISRVTASGLYNDGLRRMAGDEPRPRPYVDRRRSTWCKFDPMGDYLRGAGR